MRACARRRCDGAFVCWAVHAHAAQAYKVVATCQLPTTAIPVHVHASGLFDVDYRLLICARNACVYTVKRAMTEVGWSVCYVHYIAMPSFCVHR